jgi:hypothetical protein
MRGQAGLMNLLENILSWSSLSFLVILCGFIFARKVYQFLPLFAIYCGVLLIGTITVWLVFHIFGFNSHISYYAYWWSILINASARSLAIVELCRYGLRAYEGIWALIWRILAILSIFLLAHAAVDAWGQPKGFAIYGMTLDRDLAFASIVVVAALLLLRNYYGIALEPLQRAVSIGICIICAVDAIGNTVIRNLFTGYFYSWFLTTQRALWPQMDSQVHLVRDLWSTVHLLFFMLSVGIWCFALRNPIPVRKDKPVLLPSEVYRDLSPAINMRLASFNTRMVELLKP